MCRPRPYITGALHLGGLAASLKSLHFACIYVIAVLKLCLLEYFLIEFIEKKFRYVYDCTLD